MIFMCFVPVRLPIVAPAINKPFHNVFQIYRLWKETIPDVLESIITEIVYDSKGKRFYLGFLRGGPLFFAAGFFASCAFLFAAVGSDLTTAFDVKNESILP